MKFYVWLRLCSEGTFKRASGLCPSPEKRGVPKKQSGSTGDDTCKTYLFVNKMSSTPSTRSPSTGSRRSSSTRSSLRSYSYSQSSTSDGAAESITLDSTQDRCIFGILSNLYNVKDDINKNKKNNRLSIGNIIEAFREPCEVEKIISGMRKIANHRKIYLGKKTRGSVVVSSQEIAIAVETALKKRHSIKKPKELTNKVEMIQNLEIELFK